MRIAQRLYEGVDIGGETVGLITYMRTDGVQIADEAIAADPQHDRRGLRQDLSARRAAPLPDKAKNAQEAHEAIRPTDPTLRPQDARRHLDADQARLYELIWQRAVASQMESAELERTTVDIEAQGGEAALGTARHRHGGQVRRLPHALSGRPRRRPGGRGGQAPARHERPASR